MRKSTTRQSAVYLREWRERNLDKVREQNRRYRFKHPETHERAHIKWRAAHLDEIRERDALNAKRRRKANPEGERRRNKKFKERLLQSRIVLAGRDVPGDCELCGFPPQAGGVNRIVYDHDHETGQFRGWICDRCNKVLGLVYDNISLLAKMITYLESNGKTNISTTEQSSILSVCSPGTQIPN